MHKIERKKERKLLAVRILFISVLVVLFIASFIRLHLNLPDVSAVSPDKTKHIIGAMMLLVLMHLSYRQIPLITGVLLLFISSIFIEVLQHYFTSGRQFDLKDIYANLIGLLLGSLIILAFKYCSYRNTRKPNIDTYN